MQHQKILILDFGSQVTQLIARRVREAHVYCEVHPCDVTDEWVRDYAKDGQLKGVILSGSHASVYEVDDKAPDAVFALGVPVLGICYGMQTMAQQLGGKVEAGHTREFGYAEVRARGHTALLKDIADFTTAEGHGMLKVWMSHGDKVTELPPGFKLMASTDSCPIAGMADEARRFYAVQFHPEVTHTVQGRALLERFVLDICGTRADWIMRDHIEEAVQKIREQVGDEEVILGLSGGVDSSVAAALIHRAIGDQLTCVFVDHGLLRLNEGDMVMDMFEGKLHAKVIRVDASELFLGKLAGVSEPEQKRKIIGGLFVDVFKQEAAKLKAGGAGHKGATFLAQGTIYPDVIESGGAKSKKAVTIKSHHNVGGLPEQLGLKLLGTPARPVQGRSARTGRGPGSAPRDGVSPSLPRPWPGRAHPGRGEKRTRRPAAPCRRDLHRGTAQLQGRSYGQDLVRPHQPSLHRVPAGQERGCHG
jgi:GMP synthase (glutamine-hydrolysing)